MKSSIILIGIACSALNGCSGGSSDRAGSGPDIVEVAGGMDGAGSISVSLHWDRGVFQPVWENGELAYVVSNAGDEDVDLGFVRASCTDVGTMAGCTYAETIATWHLPAHSLRKVSDADAALLSETDGLLAVLADTQRLGLLAFPEQTPMTSERAVVSNAGINTTSYGTPGYGQIETEFLTVPSTGFTVHLALPAAGNLVLSSTTDPAFGIAFVDILGAESSQATVLSSDSGFSIAIPESASREAPVHVAVDVRLPEGFTGSMVGFDAWFCAEADAEGECQRGGHVGRALPVEAPLP